LQVRVLPQELIRCLRSDGVRVEGDRSTGATPDKRGPRTQTVGARKHTARNESEPLLSLVNVSRAVMLGERGAGWFRRISRTGMKAAHSGE